MDQRDAVLLSLAVDYYGNMRLQLDPETAMTHTVQRFDVDPRDVRTLYAHREAARARFEGEPAW